MVSPAISDSGKNGMQTEDVRQEPAAVCPRRRIVAQTRQAMLPLQQREQFHERGQRGRGDRQGHRDRSPSDGTKTKARPASRAAGPGLLSADRKDQTGTEADDVSLQNCSQSA